VRELENAVRHALLMISDGDAAILPEHFPQSVRETTIISGAVSSGSLRELSKEAAQKVEKGLLLKTLEETKWNKRKAADLLKIDYKTLFNKLKQYSIPTRVQ
jgi:DNA-binding NtrC family response regulator